ncbi:MAG: response regulator [Fimbriimonas sp.]
MRASLPPNEGERLAVLASYEVLDKPCEPAYADLVELARTLCGAERAAITLLDRDRQWILAMDGGGQGETPREVSFCSHTILQPDETLVVEDARLDLRFADNPYVLAEGGVRFYAGSPIISLEGLPVGVLCVFGNEVRDFSARERDALAALSRQVATQLELRRTLVMMRRQAEALARAKDEAEAANRARHAFLENIGYEIRTPMNGIVGLAAILASTPLSARQRQYVETIAESGKSLMGVLADVLDYAESGTGLSEVQRVPTHVAAVVEEVVAMVRPAAMAKRLRLAVEVEPALAEPIESDPVRLRQMVAAMVSVAVRVAELGAVVVRARLDARFLAIDVQTPAEGSAVAESLTKVGTIAEAMQGEIRCDRAGTGCLLTLRLPLPFAIEEPRVLVAEDNEVNSLVLSAMLEEYGCRVICVEDGAAAVEALERERFDLVFMDIQMPGMDGVEATQLFRRRETSRRTPIVAVTASSLSEDRAHFREAGIDDLIEKPISERTIVDALRRWLPTAV